MQRRVLLRHARVPCRQYTISRSYATTGVKDELVSKMQKALLDAMRAKDSSRAQVLKSALADIQTFQHEKKPPPTVQTLLSSLSKRKEAVKIYLEQNRPDLVEQFNKEIQVLEGFVPPEAKEMTLEEMGELVQKVLAELGGKSEEKGMLNKVIKEVRTRAGLRAQNLGRELAESVKKALT